MTKVVNGPGGIRVEFPDDATDDEINSAMEQAASSAPAPAVKPIRDFSGAALLEQGQKITNKGIETDTVGTGEKLTDAQRRYLTETEDFDPSAPVGSAQNPFVAVGRPYTGTNKKKQGKFYTPVAPAGAYKLLPDGTLSQQKAKKNQMLGLTTGIRRAVNNVSAMTGNEEGIAARQRDKDMIERARLSGQEPGIVGDITGSVVGTAPFVAATRNPWIGGGIGGAVNTEADLDDPSAIATDAALGAAGGKAFDVAGRAIGSVIAPRFSDAVNRLLAEGVELTPGQMFGGAGRRMEDASTSIPIIGDVVAGAKRNAQTSFNEAALRRVLDPIGVDLPPGVRSGHEAVNFAYNAVRDRYHSLLDNAWGQIDNVALQELQGLGNLMQGMGRNEIDQVQRFVTTQIQPRFSNNGQISGEAFKEIDSVVGQEARDFRRSLDPNQRRLGQAYQEMQRILRGAFERSNPRIAPDLRASDAAYQNLLRVEAAAANAVEGTFSPQQLRTASRSMDSTMRKRASAHGDAPMQDLADDAAAVLNQIVPDSGTASRGLINAATGAALVGAAPTIAPNPLLMVALASSLLPYTRTGGRVTRALAAARPQGANRLREIVDSTSRSLSGVAGGLVPQPRDSSQPEDLMRD